MENTDNNSENAIEEKNINQVMREYEDINRHMIGIMTYIESTATKYAKGIDPVAGIANVNETYKKFIKASKLKFGSKNYSAISYGIEEYDQESFKLFDSMSEGITALTEQLENIEYYFENNEPVENNDKIDLRYNSQLKEQQRIIREITKYEKVKDLLENELELRYFGDAVLKNIDGMKFSTIKLNEDFFNNNEKFKDQVMQSGFDDFKEALENAATDDKNLFLDYYDIIERYNPAKLWKKDRALLSGFEEIIDKILEDINESFTPENAESNAELINGIKEELVKKRELESGKVVELQADKKQSLEYLSKIKAKFANEKLITMFLGVEKYKQNYENFHKSVANISKSDIGENLYESIRDTANNLDEQMLTIYEEMENSFNEQFNLILKIDHEKYPELTSLEIYEKEITNLMVKKQIEMNISSFVDCVLKGELEVASEVNALGKKVVHTNPIKHKLEIISKFNLQVIEATGVSILENAEVKKMLESAFKQTRQSVNAAGEPIFNVEIEGAGFFKGNEETKGVGYIFSEKGKPLYEMSEEGKPKYITDELGNRKYEIDEFTTDLRPKYELDKFGNRQFILDKRGNAVFGTDQSGKPKFILDKKGNKLCDVNESGFIESVEGKDFYKAESFTLINENGEKTQIDKATQITIDGQVIGYKFKQENNSFFADKDGNPLFQYGKNGEILHSVNGDLKFTPNKNLNTNIIKEKQGKKEVLFLTDENGNKFYELDYKHIIKNRVNANGDPQQEVETKCAITKTKMMETGLNESQSNSYIEMLRKGMEINAFREKTSGMTELQVEKSINEAAKIYESHRGFSVLPSANKILELKAVQLSPEDKLFITPQQQANIDAITYIKSSLLVGQANAIINDTSKIPSEQSKQMEEFLTNNNAALPSKVDKDNKEIGSDIYTIALKTFVDQLAIREEKNQYILLMSYQQPEKKQAEMLFAHEYNGLVVEMSGEKITEEEHVILNEAFIADVNYGVLKMPYAETDLEQNKGAETDLEQNKGAETDLEQTPTNEQAVTETSNKPQNVLEQAERVRGMRLRPAYYDLTVEDYERIIASLDKAINNLKAKTSATEFNNTPVEPVAGVAENASEQTLENTQAQEFNEQSQPENENSANFGEPVTGPQSEKLPLKQVTLDDFKYAVISKVVATTKDNLNEEIKEFNDKLIDPTKLDSPSYRASVENVAKCQTLMFSERKANIELMEEMASAAVRTSESDETQLEDAREVLCAFDKKKTGKRLGAAKKVETILDIKKEATARELLTDEVQSEELATTVENAFAKLTPQQKQFIVENGYEEFFSTNNLEFPITDELKTLISAQAIAMKTELDDLVIDNVIATNTKLEQQAEKSKQKEQAEQPEQEKQA